MLRITLFLLLVTSSCFASSSPSHSSELRFPIPLEHYASLEAARAAELGRPLTILETLSLRASQDPLNVLSLVLFLFAILHTFFTAKFRHWAHQVEKRHLSRAQRSPLAAKPQSSPPHPPHSSSPTESSPSPSLPTPAPSHSENSPPTSASAPILPSFLATLLHFLGEVEAVFGIWLIPLFLCIFLSPKHGWSDATAYIDSRNFTEPIFVVCIMAIASSRPILDFANLVLRSLASLAGSTPIAWWFSILTFAPLLGSFITEPAAMTIAALLLSQQFYRLNPPTRLRYATIGLLFVNVSVGGTLTHFAAPPVLMVANTWHWNLPYMFTHFGWKAIIGIVLSNLLYAFLFRKDFARLAQTPPPSHTSSPPSAPPWIIAIHLLFLVWTVLTLHHPPFFLYGFLLFLAFTHATPQHQSPLSLRGPVLVGFFLASLVVHGGLQGWWISVLLANLDPFALFLCSTILTAFNDNAAITYLASQVPAFSPDVLLHGQWLPKEGLALAKAHALEYAVVVGAVTGGGLTVIANAPNPAGQNILQRFFGPDGISPAGLFLAALPPTIILGASFLLLP